MIGTLSTTPADERQIVAPIVIITSSTDPCKPLGMINRIIGGGNFGSPPLNGQYGVADGFGLNNVGLLIKTCGLIIESGLGYIVIDDGSGIGIRVDTSGLASPPTTGYISIIGLSSMYPGHLPLVLPRRREDIKSY